MATNDTVLSQLRKRCEALRGTGLYRVVVIEAEPDSRQLEDFPAKYRDPAGKGYFTQSTILGEGAACSKVHVSRWLRPESDVGELRSFMVAAVRQLAEALLEAGLLLPAEVSRAALPPSSQLEAAWLTVLVRHSEKDGLPSSGDVRGWFHWQHKGVLTCSEQMAKRAREATDEQRAADGFLHAAEIVDRSARYAVVDNVVEASLAVLSALEDCNRSSRKKPRGASEKKPKKPFPSIRVCCLSMLADHEMRQRLLECRTQQQVCDYIKQVYPWQPATPQLLCTGNGWPAEVETPWKTRKGKAIARVIPESQLGPNFDLKDVADHYGGGAC